VVTGQNPDGLPPSLLRGQNTNFTPRIGIAYRPWTKSHFVIRAGYGMFYDDSVYQRLVTGNLVSQPPFATSSTLVTLTAQVLTLQNGFPAVSPNVLTNTYAVDPGYHTPYAQTRNFTLQDEIFPNVILDVGYLGTVGRHLDLLLGPNPAGSNNTPNALQYSYETAGADSNYNALQISLRRQFHRGLSIWDAIPTRRRSMTPVVSEDLQAPTAWSRRIISILKLTTAFPVLTGGTSSC
jgi:hypothetical protein